MNRPAPPDLGRAMTELVNAALAWNDSPETDTVEAAEHRLARAVDVYRAEIAKLPREGVIQPEQDTR